MKRYDLDGFENGITEKADGWLVYYDDVQEIEAENTRLKELNREMVTTIKRVVALVVSSEKEDPIEVGCHCTDSGDAFIQCVWCHANKVLAKAELFSRGYHYNPEVPEYAEDFLNSDYRLPSEASSIISDLKQLLGWED